MHIPCTDYYFPPSQPLKPMLSVEVLQIYEDLSPRAQHKEKLMQITPNIKTLILSEGTPFTNYGVESFVDGFRVILNNLKKLEVFGWTVWRMTHHDLLYSLDAAITGFPEDFCKKMSAKLRNKDGLSAQQITSHERLREHSSILQLKGKGVK